MLFRQCHVNILLQNYVTILTAPRRISPPHAFLTEALEAGTFPVQVYGTPPKSCLVEEPFLHYLMPFMEIELEGRGEFTPLHLSCRVTYAAHDSG